MGRWELGENFNDSSAVGNHMNFHGNTISRVKGFDGEIEGAIDF